MRRTRRTILAGMLVAATVSLGYALALVPNVELMTAAVFISGYLLGAALGAAVGAVSMLIYALFNPLGASLPPLVAAQTVAFAFIGLCGAKAAPIIVTRERRLAAALSGLIGFSLTLLYDLLTSVAAYFVGIGESQMDKVIHFLLGSTPFFALHQVWNSVLFVLTVPPALRIFSTYRSELKRS